MEGESRHEGIYTGIRRAVYAYLGHAGGLGSVVRFNCCCSRCWRRKCTPGRTASTSKVGLEKDKAALLVVLGAMSDGRKQVLAVRPGHRESTESWLSVLRDLRDRGLRAPVLMMADGALPIWSAVDQVWPETSQQAARLHLPGEVSALRLDETGGMLAAATPSGFQIWDVPNRTVTFSSEAEAPTAFAFDQTGLVRSMRTI